ncbi:MAG: NmrA/HSCARG family protein, partial [Ignavibacteria bacterium]
AFSKILGKEDVYNAVPFDMFRSFGFPGAEDLGNMFQFKHDFGDYFCGVRKLDESKKLNPELQNFETWLKANKNKIPLE